MQHGTLRHGPARPAATFLAADLQHDRGLVDQVDVLIAADLLAVAITDERQQSPVPPLLPVDQSFPTPLEMRLATEDHLSIRTDLALDDAEPGGAAPSYPAARL
ncbi:hypothetical protein QTL95_17410 [Rhizobium sp. S152]|uniref:hypothetical protein n=1 Tax=Rhizobium sp. S152 TaxID=3055038 RepID=UPI0025AA1531|nr:hypothetical protein [Rhizobium sp. S152]MDM9627679.1 hypothetical protein [Rhizobium sp. S152]